jgi:ATP-dependent phosphoenolpyruvate carboxykinase
MWFDGDWEAGALQKAIVTLLALRMEAQGLHPFHSSAVRYKDKTILFLGG